MVNKVLLVGNLTADPDVKATPKGTYIANLRLATNTYAGKDEAGNAKKACRVPQPRCFRPHGGVRWAVPAQGPDPVRGGPAPDAVVARRGRPEAVSHRGRG